MMKKATGDMQHYDTYGYVETSDPQFNPDPPIYPLADDTHTGLWPDVTPVNTELALGWKVLIVLATFPWWYGVAHLIMVGW